MLLFLVLVEVNVCLYIFYMNCFVDDFYVVMF